MRALIVAVLIAVASGSGIGYGGPGRGYGAGPIGAAVVIGKSHGRGYGGYGRGYGGLGYGHLGVGKAVAAVRPAPIVHGVHKAVAVDYAEPRPYHYQYAVDDPHYGPMFNKQEEADGAGNVVGSYAVNLPDGRTQIVKYVADGYSGFNAEVSYEGYAHHPQVARGYGYGGGRVGYGGGRIVGLAGGRGAGLAGGRGRGLVGGYGRGRGLRGGYGRVPVYRH
ncbi:adult-specific cuticular protein ACP-20-like [Amphibalanus amphitrite]|uniref:adult-specific cuticular protein ACP-20-like n=1 Tax=Amphibalanus amphitrite TaxID=1232801 RepID=UPI001C9270D1|nr:adult-specific cuticular protein ACP-20-like [Amphibalanus amphitrite]